MNNFLTVFNFTLLQRIKSKSFLIVTALLMISIVIMSNFDKIKTYFSDSDVNIAITSENTQISEELKKFFNNQSDEENIEEVELSIGKKALTESKYDYLLEVYEVDNGYKANVYTVSQLSNQQIEYINQIINDMNLSLLANKYEIQNEDILTLYSDNVNVNKMNDDKISPGTKKLNMTIVVILLSIGFFIIINYSNQIAVDVAKEKSSRVVEMIVTSVKPSVHILAKCLAVLSVALIQISIIALTVIASNYLVDFSNLFEGVGFEYGESTTMVIIYSLIFLLLGLLTYIGLASLLGAVTLRIENIGQTMMPVTMLSLAGFYIAIFSLNNTDSSLVKITSFVPLISPFVMMLRTISYETSNWQFLIGILINIVTAIAIISLSVKLYKGNIFTFQENIWKQIKTAIKVK